MANQAHKEWLSPEEFFAELETDPEARRLRERLALARAAGDAVIDYRIKHRLSQRALAARLGVGQSHVARLEACQHNPSVEMLQRLSEKLGLRFVLDVGPVAAESLTLPPGVEPVQEITTPEGTRLVVAAG
jgi:ribosome-binding protein aMBF1 (putative translation factor)